MSQSSMTSVSPERYVLLVKTTSLRGRVKAYWEIEIVRNHCQSRQPSRLSVAEQGTKLGLAMC